MNEINEYFKKYSTAFLSCDPDVLPPFYHLPCLIHDLDGVHLIDSEQAVRDYETPMLEALKKQQVTEILSEVKKATRSEGIPHSVYCSVAYHFKNKHQEMILDLDYDYVLIKTANVWSMLFAQCGTIRINKL